MPSASFMSFMLFMSFLFRLLESQPTPESIQGGDCPNLLRPAVSVSARGAREAHAPEVCRG